MGKMSDSKSSRANVTMWDPMDLSGKRAEYTQDTIMDTIARAADEALMSAKKRYKKITALQQPFINYGRKALKDDSIKPFSQQFHRNVEEGGRSINRQMAARGMTESTVSGEQLTDMALSEATNEIARQHQNRMDKMKIGQYATTMLGQAGQQLGQSALNIGQAQGAGIESSFNAYGAQRAASMRSFGNAAQNIGNYYDNRNSG